MIKEEKSNNKITKPEVYNEAKIIRDKHTKRAVLEINTEGEWYLYAGNSVEKINLESPIASGKDRGTYPLYVSPTERTYFKLVTNHGEAILAETHLPMAGGYNFRDLGGLKSSEGKRIKWGKVFRSDDLYHLTEEDLAYLSSIPIKTVVDFRCKEECDILPDKQPESVENYCHLEIHPGSLQAFSKSSLSTEDEVKNAMKNLYKLFVTQKEYIDTYKEFFALVQEENKLPLMFHCSAGKDRTGFAAALLLKALDIPEDLIIRDYMLSNTYLGDKYKALFNENPKNKYLYTVIPEYLETAFTEIEKQYGTLTIFMKEALNIDTEKLKNSLLF